jgi:transcriptional regulator with XRE-family HTH domain
VPPLVEVFAANVRALRVVEGMTQRELAALLRLSVPYVEQLERGARGAAFELIEQCSEIFRVEPAYLLQENDVPRRRMTGRALRIRRKVAR